MTRLNERPLGDVLQDIVGHIQEIVRSEFLLAKADVKEEAAKASTPVATIAIGGLFGVYAGGFLLLAIVYALAMVIAPWEAAVLVSVVVGIISISLIHHGKSRLKRGTSPQKTSENLKEHLEWTKSQSK